MGEDINQAVLKADRDIQAALRDFDRSLADMARQRELDANIAQRRGALESELRPQEQGIRERFEARRREFQASRSLKELEHQLTKDLAEADTEEEKKQAQARFDEAKAELARDQGLAAEEREFMRRLAEEEVAELAGIEQRRVDFENTLREEAHLRDIARVHQQRDERVTAINDALAQEQAAIISAAEAETKKLKEQHELRVKDLQEQVVDKIPDLTGQADETITAFLEGIEKNIGGMAAQAIADAGRAQTAIAAVITAAQNAQQAISNIGSPAATFNMGVALAGSRQHGGHVAAGNAYLVGEAGPELLTMGNTSGHVTPNHRLGGGIDYDRLAAAMLRAMQGMAVEMDGERVGRLVAPHIAPANARSIAL